MQQTQYEYDLAIAVQELRDRYARCHSKYDQLQTKFFALLAGQLTIATLLFSNYFSGSADSLKLPITVAGWIFFVVASAMLIIAIGISFWSVSSNRDWAETPERVRILDNDEIKKHPGPEFLERIKADYNEAINVCDNCHEERAFRLDWSIRLFIISVIILLVVKFGGA